MFLPLPTVRTCTRHHVRTVAVRSQYGQVPLNAHVLVDRRLAMPWPALGIDSGSVESIKVKIFTNPQGFIWFHVRVDLLC